MSHQQSLAVWFTFYSGGKKIEKWFFSLLLSCPFPCSLFTISHVNNSASYLNFPSSWPLNVSMLLSPNPTLCLLPSIPFVVSCGLPQIVSPTACGQVVVRQCSIWIMMCWISPNLVMDVLLPLGGASMDGWNFIRFHGALEYNSWKVLSCVCGAWVGALNTKVWSD